MIKNQNINLVSVKKAIECASYLQLERICVDLEDRVRALEKAAQFEKTRRNKLILREVVKDARAKILEANNLPFPMLKHNWYYCLDSLTRQQLVAAHVPLKTWPNIKEILSPSSIKLNDWVYGYTAEESRAVIEEMNPTNQKIWSELRKLASCCSPSFEHAQGKNLERNKQNHMEHW